MKIVNTVNVNVDKSTTVSESDSCYFFAVFAHFALVLQFIDRPGKMLTVEKIGRCGNSSLQAFIEM